MPHVQVMLVADSKDEWNLSDHRGLDHDDKMMIMVFFVTLSFFTSVAAVNGVDAENTPVRCADCGWEGAQKDLVKDLRGINYLENGKTTLRCPSCDSTNIERS
jgi:predicted Zn-ribbon and HTH transcriptional regulator